MRGYNHHPTRALWIQPPLTMVHCGYTGVVHLARQMRALSSVSNTTAHSVVVLSSQSAHVQTFLHSFLSSILLKVTWIWIDINCWDRKMNIAPQFLWVNVCHKKKLTSLLACLSLLTYYLCKKLYMKVLNDWDGAECQNNQLAIFQIYHLLCPASARVPSIVIQLVLFIIADRLYWRVVVSSALDYNFLFVKNGINMI